MGDKHIFASKTFWAGLIMLLAVLFPHVFAAFGLGDDYSAYADKLVGLVAMIGVIKGRLDAGGVRLAP